MIESFIVAAIILAIVAPWLYRILKDKTGWILAILPATLCTGLISTLAELPLRSSYQWIPGLNISLSFYIDGLSLLFLLLISGIGVFILIYSGGYLNGHPLLTPVVKQAQPKHNL